MLVVDQLVCLAEDARHVGHVPMAHVGAEHRVQPRAQRVEARVEGQGHTGIVGLAAEVEARDEAITNVLGGIDASLRPLVRMRRLGLELRERLRELRNLLMEEIVRVLLEEPHDQRLVDARGVEVADGLAVALLPVADDVGVELARPAHAPLEHAERQLRKAMGHTAHEERAALGFHARAERADVIRHVARNRAAAPPTHSGGVRRRDDLELDAAAARTGRSRTRCRARDNPAVRSTPNPSWEVPPSGRPPRRWGDAPDR